MSETLSRDVVICNQRGLHARAAAKFVRCVSQFQVEIEVIKDGQSVSGLSIMGLMMLAATKGSTVTVTAKGTDAQAAMDALVTLIESRFGENE